MKKLLIQHLELNETILVQEWHAQFIRDLQRPDFDADENGLKVIAQLYSALLLALKGKSERAILLEMFFAGQEISEAKLPLLLTVLISGEEVMRDDLLINLFGMHQFEPTVSAELFEIVNDAFHKLMREYATKLCVDCFDGHSRARRKASKQKQIGLEFNHLKIPEKNRVAAYEPKF